MLAVLLLRGPQTPGELKARTERMAPLASLADVERISTRSASVTTRGGSGAGLDRRRTGSSTCWGRGKDPTQADTPSAPPGTCANDALRRTPRAAAGTARAQRRRNVGHSRRQAGTPPAGTPPAGTPLAGTPPYAPVDRAGRSPPAARPAAQSGDVPSDPNGRPADRVAALEAEVATLREELDQRRDRSLCRPRTKAPGRLRLRRPGRRHEPLAQGYRTGSLKSPVRVPTTGGNLDEPDVSSRWGTK